MSADKIVEKIISKAEEDIALIQKEANEKAQVVVNIANKKTETTLITLENKKTADVEEIFRRGRLMTRLDSRKNTLAVKRSVIDTVFAEAKTVLNNLDDARWAALITKIVLSGAETGSENIMVPEKDMNKYTNPFMGKDSMLEQLNKALEKSGKKGALTLCNTPANFESGIMLVGVRSDVNGSFDVLLKEARDQYEREVYEILFETEV